MKEGEGKRELRICRPAEPPITQYTLMGCSLGGLWERAKGRMPPTPFLLAVPLLPVHLRLEGVCVLVTMYNTVYGIQVLYQGVLIRK